MTALWWKGRLTDLHIMKTLKGCSLKREDQGKGKRKEESHAVRDGVNKKKLEKQNSLSIIGPGRSSSGRTGLKVVDTNSDGFVLCGKELEFRDHRREISLHVKGQINEEVDSNSLFSKATQ